MQILFAYWRNYGRANGERKPKKSFDCMLFSTFLIDNDRISDTNGLIKIGFYVSVYKLIVW